LAFIDAPEKVTASASGDLPNGIHQHSGIVSLGDVALRPEFDGANHKRWIIIHAEHDDFGVRIFLADAPHQLEAGNVGKLDIDDRDVRLPRNVGPVTRLGIRGHMDLHSAVRGEQRPAARQDYGVIIDD
jgi:hypothetical protein